MKFYTVIIDLFIALNLNAREVDHGKTFKVKKYE